MTDQNEENECTRDGVVYVFVEIDACVGCVALNLPLCSDLPHCVKRFRIDKRNGQWTRKEPQQ